MQAMDDALKEGQSLNEAHEEAVEKVDEADYLDKYMSGGSYYDNNKALSDEELSDSELDLEPYMEGGAYELQGGFHWSDVVAPIMSVAGDMLLGVAAGMNVDEPEDFSEATTKPNVTTEADAERSGLGARGTIQSGRNVPEPISSQQIHELQNPRPAEQSSEATTATEENQLLTGQSEEPAEAEGSQTLSARAKQLGKDKVNELADKAADRLNLRRRYKNEPWIGKDGKKGYLRRIAPRAGVASLGVGLQEGADVAQGFGRRAGAETTRQVTACVDNMDSLPNNQCEKLLRDNGIEPPPSPEARERRERQSRDAALAADWQRTRDRSENPYLN
jgi:hypothetical protein